MTAPLKARKKVILLKIESSYGTDAAPVAANDGMLVANVEFNPFVSNNVPREVVQAYLGSRELLVTGLHVTLAFDIEIAGAGGAVDDVPAYGPALRACAHQQVVNATTSVQYNPIDSGEESATIHFHMDGQKHTMVGCRGNREIRINANQIPYYHFEFMGMYVAPGAAADPAPALTGFKIPATVNNTNTPTFTLHGYAGKLLSLTLNQGNVVEYFNLPGEESIQITDRQSTGQIVIEAPPLGTKDFFAAAKAQTLAALQVIHGVGTGYVNQFDGANTQILNPRYGEQGSRVTLAADLALVPSSTGSDEWQITTT